MVDTVRTRAAVLALLADNSTGDISPQDVRDAIVSMFGVYAFIYVSDGAVAQAGVTTTPTLMTGFAANGINSDATPDHTTDSITINTAGDYEVKFQCAFSGAINTMFQFHVRVDAAEQVYGTRRMLSASGDEGSCSITGGLTLAAAEVVTIYVESDNGGGASFTPIDASLSVLKIG